MSVTATLFDRWKAAKKHSSDRAALAALGVSHGAAVHWKAGRNADADVIERMANDLGENAGALIAQAMAESAKGDAARTWARLAKQLGAAAAVAAVAVVALPYITANEAGDASALAMGIMRSGAWTAGRPPTASRNPSRALQRPTARIRSAIHASSSAVSAMFPS